MGNGAEEEAAVRLPQLVVEVHCTAEAVVAPEFGKISNMSLLDGPRGSAIKLCRIVPSLARPMPFGRLSLAAQASIGPGR